MSDIELLFFGDDVSAFMKLILEKNIDPLVNGTGCIEFVSLISKLIRTMSSRTPENALTNDSSEKKVIIFFQLFENLKCNEAVFLRFIF